MKRALPLGLVLLAASAIGWAVAPRMVLASWLAAWWWALGIVFGCLANAWMQVLTGGAWGAPVRATALVLARRLPWLLLGLLVVAATVHRLYPWAMEPSGAWTKALARPGFVRVWLEPSFFMLRLLAYAIVWWLLSRPATLASKGRAAASLIAYALSMTLAAVDLLMSLMPGWYSTAFGLVVMSTQALSGAAAVVLLSLVRGPAPWPAAEHVPVSRDIGNLLLMWSMSWGYLAFMQFLIIWAENLPREIAWFVPRLQTGWQWMALALAFAQLVVPFVALLFRSVKDRPQRLAMVALLLLASTALDVAWTVLPSVDAHNLHAWWIQPLAFAGMALLLLGAVEVPRPQSPRVELGHA